MRVRYSGLPSGYRRVKYLESTGTQYIDTGYKGKANDVVEIKMTALESGVDKLFYGSYESNSVYSIGQYGNYYRFNVQEVNTLSVQLDVGTPKIFQKKSNGYWSYNGVQSGWVTANNSTKNAYLFARNYSSLGNSKMRLYYCKIWNDTTIVRNFVPCIRTSDSKPGLYDTINSVFYTNSGSGEFLYGPYDDSYWAPLYPRLPSAYQEVEYIQSDGGQAIDTGIKLDMDNAKVEIDFQATTASQTGMILASTSNRGNYWWIYHYSGSGLINCYLDGTSGNQQNLQGPARDTNKHKAIYQNKTYYVDNIRYGTATGNLGSTIDNLFMFKWSATDTSFPYKGRIYNCKIWNDGTHLTKHFIPCYRKSDSAIGFYDTIKQTFYTNSGSGTFTKGADVNNIVLTHPSYMYAEGTTNYGRMNENIYLYSSSLASSWSIEKLDRDTVKVTALVDNPSYGTYGNITQVLGGTVTVSAGTACTLSCEIVDYKGSLGRLYPCSGGFGSLIGYGTYCGRVYRTITHTSGWTHDICIRSSSQSNIQAGDYLIIRNTQIEIKDHPTLYTPSTRPDNTII